MLRGEGISILLEALSGLAEGTSRIAGMNGKLLQGTRLKSATDIRNQCDKGERSVKEHSACPKPCTGHKRVTYNIFDALNDHGSLCRGLSEQ